MSYCKKDVCYTILKSGCKMLTIPRRDTRATHIAFFVRVGSRDERRDEIGMAHFLEHMLFKGNKKLSSQLQITKKLDEIGSDYNAFTSKNTTCYHISVASKDAVNAFTTYSNMILHSTLEKHKMKKEKQVVVEEYNKMIDNVIRFNIENVFGIIFKGTVLGRPTIGYVEDIMNLTHNSLNKFYRRHYKKNNMLIAVSGKIPKELFTKIYGIYGKPTRVKPTIIKESPELNSGFQLPLGMGLPRPIKIKLHKCSSSCNAICIDQRKEVKQSNILIAYKIDGGLFNEDIHTLELIGQYLGGGMSSILFQKIRTRLGLAYTINCELELYEEAGVFMIYAGTEKANTQKVVVKILEEVEKICKEMIKKSDIRSCLNTIIGRISLAEENGMNLCLSYGSRALFDAKIYTTKMLTEKFSPKKMTPRRVLEVAKKYLTPKNLYISILGDQPFVLSKRLLKK